MIIFIDKTNKKILEVIQSDAEPEKFVSAIAVNYKVPEKDVVYEIKEDDDEISERIVKGDDIEVNVVEDEISYNIKELDKETFTFTANVTSIIEGETVTVTIAYSSPKSEIEDISDFTTNIPVSLPDGRIAYFKAKFVKNKVVKTIKLPEAGKYIIPAYHRVLPSSQRSDRVEINCLLDW